MACRAACRRTCSRASRSAAPTSRSGAGASPSHSAGPCHKPSFRRSPRFQGSPPCPAKLLSFAATDNDDHVLAFGWAADSFYWDTVPLLEGGLPKPDEPKAALIGKDIARTLDKHVGDNITLLGEKFHIVGVTNYSSIINRNAVIVELADLQEVTFRTGAVTFISVKLDQPGDSGEADRITKPSRAWASSR